MAGKYCPTDSSGTVTILPCPRGYWCPAGSVQPRPCPELSICSEGTISPLYYGPLIYCLVLDVIFFILYRFISKRYIQINKISPSSPTFQKKKGSAMNLSVYKSLFQNVNGNNTMTIKLNNVDNSLTGTFMPGS
jgi:hypothetical protein